MKTEVKYIKNVLKKESEINLGISKIAKEINENYKNEAEEVIFIIVAKGGVFYAIDLLKKITFDSSLEFIFSSSYKFKRKVKKPKIKFNKTISLKNKRLIIVDDIVETGETTKKIIKVLEKHHPKDIAVTALFGTNESEKLKIKTYFCWKKNKDDFLMGYGLDYDEKYRNLNYISVMK